MPPVCKFCPSVLDVCASGLHMCLPVGGLCFATFHFHVHAIASYSFVPPSSLLFCVAAMASFSLRVFHELRCFVSLLCHAGCGTVVCWLLCMVFFQNFRTCTSLCPHARPLTRRTFVPCFQNLPYLQRFAFTCTSFYGKKLLSMFRGAAKRPPGLGRVAFQLACPTCHTMCLPLVWCVCNT